jgi:CDK-activating kinase assembly factor MAT1
MFSDEDQFRDYEEMVEDIIFNLANNIDVELTNKQVAAYQKENLKTIAEVQSRVQRENERVKEQIMREEESRWQRINAEQELVQNEKILKIERAKQLNEIALGVSESESESESPAVKSINI